VTLQAKMLRLELLDVKADLERELGRLVLYTARRAGQRGHWVAGLSVTPGELHLRSDEGAYSHGSRGHPGRLSKASCTLARQIAEVAENSPG
jgi:hypothetical protein